MSAAENFPVDAKIATAKKATRQTIKRRLAELAFNRADVASRLFLNLERLPEFRAAETLGVYLDFGSEAPIRPFLPRLFDRPKRVVAVPRCVDRELEFYRLAPPTFLSADAVPPNVDFVDVDAFSDARFSLVDLTLGAFGIWEPLPEPSRRVFPEAFDVVLVPGLAFDLNGGRLGRGAGFYDRFLAALPSKTRLIGVALDEQIVEKAPRDAFDLPVDALVTPSRTVVFG
ncbi:MAG: 5-formyltetrahydrofolate cyclo-ligase [Thermoguttaceae bacterium]|nr:5-formyltetrahydrofolate cyclo-ligase [Thermoguttaceae bacterium]